jgi:hypothetical protein
MKNLKPTLKKLAFGLLFGAVGAGLGYAVGHWLGAGTESPGPGLAWPDLLAMLPALLLALWVTLALHELGHVLAGLAVGFEFRLFVVGPLMLEREAGRFRFKWNRNLNTAGGLALCLPQGQHRLAQRFSWFAAGGPLASLVWAGLAAGLFLAARPVLAEHGLGLAVATFLVTSALCSPLIFLVTIIPMHVGGFDTDGARILNLWRRSPKATLDLVLLQSSVHLMTGTRPRDLDPAPLVAALDLPTAGPFKGYLHSFLHYHYLDRGVLGPAAEQLARFADYLPGIPRGYQAAVWLDRAYFAARHEGDAAAARQHLAQAEIGAAITPSKVLRAEAALALAEGDHDLAIDKAQQALAQLPKSMEKGTALAEREWLEGIVQAAERARQAPVVDQIDQSAA